MTVHTLLDILKDEGYTTGEIFIIIAYFLPPIDTFEYHRVTRNKISAMKQEWKMVLKSLEAKTNFS